MKSSRRLFISLVLGLASVGWVCSHASEKSARVVLSPSKISAGSVYSCRIEAFGKDGVQEVQLFDVKATGLARGAISGYSRDINVDLLRATFRVRLTVKQRSDGPDLTVDTVLGGAHPNPLLNQKLQPVMLNGRALVEGFVSFKIEYSPEKVPERLIVLFSDVSWSYLK